ncbi:hypothetical protein B0J13DRAFT_306841 [Dactylonectria estremocensis]|uniref:Pentacotripeptide-repeat region of PRORP domain-containing protein n=1 Tax=Dactylonectria estremocensis TaxID=1079267 RepID=A0A9P9F0T8_9HYPO|nr:hypothetical protein B0J13DRAFT_306841 [Dactylonectria estremocensis]
MPVAHMYGAWCSRLESSMNLAWTQRAALLALRRDRARIGTILTRSYHAPSKPHTSTQQPLILPVKDVLGSPELDHQSLGLELPGRKRNPKIHEYHVNKHQQKKTSMANDRAGKTVSSLPQGRKPTFAEGVTQRRAAVTKRKILERQTKKVESQQWDYIQQQCPPEEWAAAKRQFDFWKRQMDNVMAPMDLGSLSWRDDGKWLFELDDTSGMRKAWEELDVESRTQQWPTVMLSTLHNSPHKVCQVLEATLNPTPPGFAISDVLSYYSKTLQLEKCSSQRDRYSKADEIVELVAKVVVDLPVNHVTLRQETLGILGRKLPSGQAAELYEILVQAGLTLKKNTQLHYAGALAKSSAHKRTAFWILQDIAKNGADLNDPSVASVITTLLHTKLGGEGWLSSGESSFSPQRAMEFFLEHGYSPNLVSFTALVDSLCKQGDIAEAIRLPLLLAENGAKLDERCYATVFRGAKNSLQASNVRKALDVAKAANAPYIDVLNNMLHSIFYFAETECREKKHPAPWVLPLFTPMLKIYAKKFDLKPLQWLVPDALPLILEQDHEDGPEKFRIGPRREWEFKHTIMPVVDEFFEAGDGAKQTPDSTTLTIMLRAYIKSLNRPYDIMSFYTFFKTRLEERDTGKNWAADLAKEQGSVFHDTLILAMLERRPLLRPALQVFGDMLRDSMRPKANEDGKEELAGAEEPAMHPAPTLFTFSILIHGLMRRGEKMLAEQVLQVMRDHNIEPNIVTWNTLVKGHAMMQNLSQTVGALQDLEAAGFKPDTHTFRAFAKLTDQTRALEMMEKIIDANKKRLELDQSR